ncbi:MAG: hypothetical protein ACI4AH_04535 [Muribaculaceae bacterium]
MLFGFHFARISAFERAEASCRAKHMGFAEAQPVALFIAKIVQNKSRAKEI